LFQINPTDFPLTTEEIIKKVRELEIKSKKITRHLFTGEYHSAFKGRGILFKEVREYQHGDDIRFIDWNVSARLNHTFSKLFEEERELPVILVVDISASSEFGTSSDGKRGIASEIAAVLSFSAISNNDKVGLLMYSDRVEQYIPPKKGRDHVLYMVRQLLTMEAKGKSTDLYLALRRMNNLLPQQCIVFILSDFLQGPFEDAIKMAGRRHDLIGIKIYDAMDMQLPDIGLLQCRDPETGQVRMLDTHDFAVREDYKNAFFAHTEKCRNAFLKAGCDLLHIRTDEDYVKVLQRFFMARNR
jgi:uncharacterized protein (DUF58 family)